MMFIWRKEKPNVEEELGNNTYEYLRNKQKLSQEKVNNSMRKKIFRVYYIYYITVSRGKTSGVKIRSLVMEMLSDPIYVILNIRFFLKSENRNIWQGKILQNI